MTKWLLFDQMTAKLSIFLPHSQIKCKTEQLLLNKLFYSIFSLESIFSFSLSILFFLTLSWSIFVYLYQSLSFSIYLNPSGSIMIYFGVTLSILVYLWLSWDIPGYIRLSVRLSLAISPYSDYLWLSLSSIKHQGASRSRRGQVIACW